MPVTPLQVKIASAVVSALTAAGICFVTAWLANVQSGHESPMALKIAAGGALLSLLKDAHSFTSTAPKDIGNAL